MVDPPELIDSETAFAQRRNRYSLWKKARDRLIDEVWPELNPSFRIQPGAKIFTTGSCFARNVEEFLHRLGFRIPTLDLKVPMEEYPARPNGILNKYTPAAIFQEIDWTRRIFQRGEISRNRIARLSSTNAPTVHVSIPISADSYRSQRSGFSNGGVRSTRPSTRCSAQITS